MAFWNASSLLPCFQWRDGARLARDTRNHLLTRVASTVRSEALYSTPQVRAELLGRLRALPPASLQELLGAPELMNRLVQADRGEGGFEGWFRDALCAEEARFGARPLQTWSATGDLGPGPDGQPGLAPRLDGIPIDARSPWLEHPLDGGEYRSIRFGRVERYDDEALGRVLARLEEARALILSARPSVWEFVRQSTRVIQLRQDGTNPGFYTSASCNAQIGRLVLLNAHLDAFDVPGLANALVHESIHAVLYGLEQISPFLPTVDPQNSDHLLVSSPWTGSRLHLHTYLHACFVWFGLAGFWRAFERPLDAEEQRHLRRAVAGFRGGAALAPLREHAALLGEGVMETVEVLSALVGADEDAPFRWEPVPVAAGRHGLGLRGVERATGRPVFGKLATRARSDRAITREGRILGGLASLLGVPAVLDAGTLSGRALLVLEALERRPLQVDIQSWLRLACGLAGCLAEVHGRGILHRDVRADHLLWRGEQLVLVDFSCALDLEEAGVSSGTVGHWASSPPDQLLPDRPVPGAHWDTYAACATLFLLLMGRLPACQTHPEGRLSERGRQVWAAAHAAVSQTPVRDDPALRRAFAQARAGLDYAALVAPDPAPGLLGEEEDAVVAAVVARGGGEDLGWAIAAILSRGLDARPERRFADGATLESALNALPALFGSSTAARPAPPRPQPLPAQDRA